MSWLFQNLLVEPLYNALVFLVDVLPGGDAGLAIVALTLVVKVILYPLSKKAIRTQVRMKEIEPKLREIKEKYKNDKQKQATATVALYKETGINPFSSFALIALQIPIILALYKIFVSSNLPEINTAILYSFVAVPSHISTMFLGILDITSKSLVLAILAGVTQFFQARYSIPAMPPKKDGAVASFGDDFSRSMNMQMRYFFPIITFLITWSISGAVAVYWTTSNIFAIVQEILVRKKVKRSQEIKSQEIKK